MSSVVRAARAVVKDVGIRSGLVAYRPLRWTPQRWSASYRSRATDAYGALDEVARYGVLLGYLAEVGGPAASVLDVGCGAGLLRRRMPAGSFGRYTGVDPTAEAIEQAGELARELADERTEFRRADVLTEPLGSFDVVVCNEVLYFAADPMALLDRVAQLVRPGGHVLCSIWRHPGDTVLWRAVERRFELLDRVAVRNEGHGIARRGWLIACLRAGNGTETV